MASREDLRRIALSLPETTGDELGWSYSVAGKAFVWTRLERVHPKKARVPNQDVIAVRVADESEKELLNPPGAEPSDPLRWPTCWC